VTCMTAPSYRPSSRKVYTVTEDAYHATSQDELQLGNSSTKFRNLSSKKRRKPKRSFGSSSSSGSSSIQEIFSDPGGNFLYELSSRNCPCQHHRSKRLREESSTSLSQKDQDLDFIDSFTLNNFDASVAPLRGFLTSSSSNGDSGINTNSAGSRRSSARGGTKFSISSESSEEDEMNNKEVVVTTTVIMEYDNGCDADDTTEEPDDKQQSRYYAKMQNKANNPFAKLGSGPSHVTTLQISPEYDPSNNWTLLKALNADPYMSSIQEEEQHDSLFSNSIKTSHSSSHDCVCLDHQHPQEQQKPQRKNNKISLQRVASYPKCHPDNDPHRFDLITKQGATKSDDMRHLPTVPPYHPGLWPPSNRISHSQSSSEFFRQSKKRPTRSLCHNMTFPAFECEEIQEEIPPCVRNVILQQLQSPRPPTNPKMIKKLSKTIHLPDDPSDPAAFTLSHDHPLFYDLSLKNRSKSRRSRQVVKIVGTFSFLMTMGIVITVLCFLYWSDTFKPMTMM